MPDILESYMIQFRSGIRTFDQTCHVLGEELQCQSPESMVAAAEDKDSVES